MVGTAAMARPGYTRVAPHVSPRACLVSSCPATPAAYVQPSALVFGSYGVVAVDADMGWPDKNDGESPSSSPRVHGGSWSIGACIAGSSSSSNAGVNPGVGQRGGWTKVGCGVDIDGAGGVCGGREEVTVGHCG